nr:cupin domain-containing protein [Synechococcus sp. RS9902]
MQTLIQHHGLKPHPEGGWYRELHRSPDPGWRSGWRQPSER